MWCNIRSAAVGAIGGMVAYSALNWPICTSSCPIFSVDPIKIAKRHPPAVSKWDNNWDM